MQARKEATVEEEANLLFSSGDPDEVEELKGVLDANPDANVEVVREAHLLKERMSMPFLHTPEGGRVIGVAAIRSYLEEER